MRLVRIADTPWIRSVRERAALAPLFERPRRVLAALAAPSVAPTLTARIPTSVPLTRLVRALRGRLVVANPVAVARLPWAAGALAQAALRAALAPAGYAGDGADAASTAHATHAAHADGDARAPRTDRRLAALLDRAGDEARAVLGGGAAWMAAALFEPDALLVQFGPDGAMRVPPEPPPLVAHARYRLVLAAGRGEPPARWAALDERAVAAPAVRWPPASGDVPWFAVRLLVADADVAAGMDAATLARWADLTGRAGPGSYDRYWIGESWERFREPGRVVGHVTPQVVGFSRRARTADGEVGGYAFTAEVERGVGVPPGYCLVDCVGSLEVAVVAG